MASHRGRHGRRGLAVVAGKPTVAAPHSPPACNGSSSSSTTTTTTPPPAGDGQQRTLRPGPDDATLLDVFQVYKPVLPITPGASAPPCVLTLMAHAFAFSYGRPFVTAYTPPPSCPRFNTVTLNLTVTAAGRQFDRLASLYLSSVEIFRTSTAEPTPRGIVWTHVKDSTPFLALWKSPQTLVFDMGNLVDDIYTGDFNATLTATFSTVTEPNPPETADFVLPLSRQLGDRGRPSAFILPSSTNASTTHTFPPHASRAHISLAACGQADEEFWYSAVPPGYSQTFLNTTGLLPSFSPFREVQVLIDGHFAGAVWPFPTIFTGGLAPGLWRPLVGMDAFDLRMHEVDITPFVPYLSDGDPHTFELRLVGVSCCDERGSHTQSDAVSDYWVVSGAIFLFVDETSRPLLNHNLPSITAPPLAIEVATYVGKNGEGENDTLLYRTRVLRHTWIQHGSKYAYAVLGFENDGELTEKGLRQKNEQRTSGTAYLYTGDGVRNQMQWKFPLRVDTRFEIFPPEDGGAGEGIEIHASVFRKLWFWDSGRPDVSTFTLSPGPVAVETTQWGDAAYSNRKNRPFSFGETTQVFWEGSRGQKFARDVKARNGTVVWDSVSGVGNVSAAVAGQCDASIDTPHFGDLGTGDVRRMLGRGPGQPDRSLL